jgi:hypothetical protein
VATPIDNAHIKQCLFLIEQKLGWGTSEDWATHDFDRLSDEIAGKTGVTLSVTTLKRIWGKVKYESAPTITTLNALAGFLDYDSWRPFSQELIGKTPVGVEVMKQQLTGKEAFQTPIADLQPVTAQSNGSAPAEKMTGRIQNKQLSRRQKWLLFGALAILVFAGILFTYSASKPAQPLHDYSFGSRAITRSIPNSVVFNYDASASPMDSVYIQQSWDSTRRVAVDKNAGAHTAIYYEPGFFQAKLVVGNKVVKEHPLIIPTDGWLATITTPGIPVYLHREEFLHPQILTLPASTIQKHKVNLEPTAPIIKYFNVGNFEPVSLRNFSFSTRIKQDYDGGGAACRYSWVVLMTDGMPVVVQLSQKGCISELNLMDGERMVSGKTTDLSAFGVDFSDWMQVAFKSDDHNLHYYINDTLVYTSPLPEQPLKIVGLVYGFQGTGSVKEVKLKQDDVIKFQDF